MKSKYYLSGRTNWGTPFNFAPKTIFKPLLKLFFTVKGILVTVPGSISSIAPDSTSTINGKNNLPTRVISSPNLELTFISLLASRKVKAVENT